MMNENAKKALELKAAGQKAAHVLLQTMEAAGKPVVTVTIREAAPAGWLHTADGFLQALTSEVEDLKASQASLSLEAALKAVVRPAYAAVKRAMTNLDEAMAVEAANAAGRALDPWLRKAKGGWVLRASGWAECWKEADVAQVEVNWTETNAAIEAARPRNRKRK